ncbi:hypothetical protein LOY55_24015 [Pseudomonas sp. B21-040]|uniref:hypothetical protein n=1 Tax=Pseudomonas sp. B21-040 TaxID=2895486 RepID=UPI00215FDCEB|nr:hypothetical protein [Pseudomonas sp. B21-040]UVL39269.1 hypothetical protein LOY55_24015 [Pseudomonas sp. B21-040]
MSNPTILADESLVLNGEFDKAFAHWKKGPLNQDWLGTETEIYNGVPIRFLKAGNESSVSQQMMVPKDPSAQARYVLSFLCETRHTEAGKLVISIEGSQDKLEIPLTPGQPRDPAVDQLRRRNGQPLVFQPIEYEVELGLPFRQQDMITVSVFSPPNRSGDFVSVICITRINIALHLASAVMQALKLDEQTLPASRPLYMCLGASASLAHRLQFIPAPDNVWRDTKAALTSDDNPQGAIVATPGWGVDHPLDDLWTLDCPWIGDEEPYLFSMNLVNQYTAVPYPLAVSLGHHRLVFREVLEAAFYPVLEHKQSVRLGVQVASYYTGQPLDGRTVNWGGAGQGVKSVAVTDNQGWAYFTYEPTAAGVIAIEASVDSPYYAEGVVTERLEVRVLATDPWKDVQAVVDGAATRWEEKTGYPNRGTAYPVNLKLAADSPLLGTELSLRWSGDSHEQLGVSVSPALETPVPVTGIDLAWTLTSADRLDGRFDLSLVCSKLQMSSPEKRMSLARNLVRVGEVREANKFPVVDENESVLLRVQVLHVVVSGDGDPVLNALVDWKGPQGVVSTVTGVGGWASYLYTPKNAGDQVVIASIKAHAEAVAVEQPFNVKAIATSPWKNEVKILLDGTEVDRVTLGVLCRRGGTHILKVVPVAGSPWIGRNISLHWRGAAPDIGLVPGNLGTLRPLVAAGLEWTLTSQATTSVSSLFELELRLEGVATARELFGRLVSADLTQEMSLVLDQIPAALDAQQLFPCLGARHRFNVLPNVLSPLVGLNSTLTWSGTPAIQLGATVEPALNLPQPITDGGAIWSLDFTASQQPGQFALALALPQLAFTATAKPMALAHNKVRIEAVRESVVDPVVGQEPAWMWVRVYSHFTGLAVDKVPVGWSAPGGASVVPTDAEGWSGFAFSPATAEKHQVEALVTSPYDGFEEKRSMGITGLASDPWAGLTVRFDGAQPQLWGTKTYFPRRKGEHTFELLAPKNSPLFDHDLTLGMTGTGPAELGIRFLSEGLGVPRAFYDAGLHYTFNAGDLKDGSFALRLSSERLASLSPANAMSLGEGAQVVKIAERSRADQTLGWGQALEEQVTVVSAISGKPMVGWTVTWRSPDLGVETSVTDYYGVAKVRFVPTTPGVAELTASVGGESNSDSMTLNFRLNEPREISELYEPTGSRQPPDESTAYAKAKVVSALTGLPLAGVEVWWEYAERALTPSQTDVDGIASLTFSLSGEGGGVLWASVEGGIGGWDTTPLLYGGVVPVIESLSSRSRDVVVGEEAMAEVRVVSRNDSQPLKGIRVNWTFPGLSLQPTITEDDGTSRVTFKPPELGEYPLTATAGFGSGKSLDFTVVKPYEIAEMKVSRSLVLLGEDLNADVRVEEAKQGIEVAWSFTGLPVTQSRTDAEGWATEVFTPTQASDNDFTVVSASVPTGTGSESTRSKKVWVFKDIGSIKPSPFVNHVPVLLPHVVVVQMKQDKDIAIGILPNEQEQAHEYAIFSARPEVTFTPPAGEFQTVGDRFNWTVNIQVPVGEEFVIVIRSKDSTIVTGLRCRVVAQTDESEQDVVIEPLDH